MKFLLLPALLLIVCSPARADEPSRIEELNAYWAEVSRCVREGDFAGYSKTCHELGVLVSGSSKICHPLSKALANWKKEFVATKAGTMKANVIFRFSKRLNDTTTAHETGIFRYTQETEGKKVEEYVHFEALLVKQVDDWKIMMEYQKSKATRKEWDALQ